MSNSKKVFIACVKGTSLVGLAPGLHTRLEAAAYIELWTRTKPEYGYVVLPYNHPAAGAGRAAWG